MHKTTAVVDRYRDQVEFSPKRPANDPNQRPSPDAETGQAEPHPLQNRLAADRPHSLP